MLDMGEAALKERIQHLGMGNKNAQEIMSIFEYLKSYQTQHLHFPRALSELTKNKGIGTKIASLILYFAYQQVEAILVDSHVKKCATSLGWILTWCKSPETIHLCLQSWVPYAWWPHVNIVLASIGQLLSS